MLTKKQLKPLFENLKGEKIENLQFWLSGSLIGDPSLLALANLKRAEGLRSLTLEVEDTKITDLSMVPFMSNLGNILSEDVNKLNFSLKRTKATNEVLKVYSEKVLENLRNLQNFKLCLEQNQAYVRTFFEIMPRKAQTIRQFEIDFNKTHSDTSLQLFAERILPNLTQVQDLRVRWSITPSDRFYETFCLNAQKTIKNIKTFNLGCFSCMITGVPGKFLEELHFELENYKMSDLNMQQILLRFKEKISTVKAFSFIIRKARISVMSIQALAAVLSIATNLESLAINLEGFLIYREEFRFTDLWQTFEKFARNLKSFKMNLNLLRLDPACLFAFAESGLALLTEKLETLRLDFGNNENNAQALEAVFGKLKSCIKNLETFSLSIIGKELLPGAIQVLATEIFPNLKSMKNFQLRLEKTKINDAGFGELFSGLKGEVLRNMKSFVLIFEEEDEITSQSLDFISAGILPQLKNVEAFGCHLRKNEKIQDESFIRFNKKLQEVSFQMTKLSLRFEQTGLTGDSINEFAHNTLTKTKYLKNLDLEFGGNMVNDEAIVNLFDGIGNVIEGLGCLDLHLPRTGITDVAIEALKEKIVPKVNHLYWFNLNVAGNSISEENKMFIADVLRK